MKIRRLAVILVRKMTGAEEKIVLLCKQGDKHAFDLLIEEYGKRLYSFV